MIAHEKQETKKRSEIPMSDASADPWTVVIVKLNAKSTLFTMESPWRSKNITSSTMRHNIIFVNIWLLQFDSMLIILIRKIPKLFRRIKLRGVVSFRQILRSKLCFNRQHVLLIDDSVISLLVWFIFRNIKLYKSISIYVWNYSRFCESTL
jgi:hypothetical protein